MDFSVTYGQGDFWEGRRHVSGQIILGPHKLFLRKDQQDLTETFIPLEKIVRIKQGKGGVLNIEVHLSIVNRFQAVLRVRPEKIDALTRELVDRLGLKKKFLAKEWVRDK